MALIRLPPVPNPPVTRNPTAQEALEYAGQVSRAMASALKRVEEYLQIFEATAAPTATAGGVGTNSTVFQKLVYSDSNAERLYVQVFNSAKLPKWKRVVLMSPDTSGLADNDLAYFDDDTDDVKFASSSTLGLVTGAASSTDNAVARWDGTTGLDIQNSGVIIDDTDNVTGMLTLTMPNVGLHLFDTDASHDLIVKPGANLTADRTLTVTTADADVTLNISTVTAGRVLRADGTNWLASTATYPDTVTVSRLLYASATNVVSDLATANDGILVTSGTGIPSIATNMNSGITIGSQYIYRTNGIDVALADGGTGASLTASNGGIFYSTAGAGAILAGTATAGQILRSGASTTPAWSTPTFPNTATSGTVIRGDGTNWLASTLTVPDTAAISTILYASSANVISALATANSGVLVTSGAGVPSIATDIPTAVTIGTAYIYRVGGTDVAVTDGGTGASTAADARTNLGLVIGTNVQAWDADLDAVAALASTVGMLARTGAGAFAVRTLTGTTNQISISNGDGSGTPTFSTPQDIHTSATPQFARLGVGTGANTAIAVYIANAALSGADQYGVYSQAVFTSASTTTATAIQGAVQTAAAAFTVANAYAFRAPTPTVGAGSAITTLSGFFANNQGVSGVTNAYGVYIDAQSGASSTNIGLYNAGTTTLAGNVTLNGGTVTLGVDTNFVTSGGVNGFSVDGTTFSIDGANNRVGIGTAAPAVDLDVRSVDAFMILQISSGSNSPHLRMGPPSGQFARIQSYDTIGGGYRQQDFDALNFRWSASGAQKAAMDASGNLSVGGVTSPTASLHTAASTTSSASLIVPAGTAPTSPNEGDVWNDSTQKSLVAYVDTVKQSDTRTLFTQTTDKTVTNDATETTLTTTGKGTLTLPANFFVAGKTVRLTASGYYSTQIVPITLNIRLKFGSTTIVATGDQTPGGAMSNRFWRVVAEITCRSTGAAGTVIAQSAWEHQSTATGSPINWEMITTTAVTVDTTAGAAIDLTADWGAGVAAGDSITCSNLSLEVLN